MFPYTFNDASNLMNARTIVTNIMLDIEGNGNMYHDQAVQIAVVDNIIIFYTSGRSIAKADLCMLYLRCLSYHFLLQISITYLDGF